VRRDVILKADGPQLLWQATVRAGVGWCKHLRLGHKMGALY